METKHTPGPWNQLEHWASITTNDGYAICDMALTYSSLSNEELEANARLIAAAPDLLEALQFLMVASGEQLTTAFEQAQEAIAKATNT